MAKRWRGHQQNNKVGGGASSRIARIGCGGRFPPRAVRVAGPVAPDRLDRVELAVRYLGLRDAGQRRGPLVKESFFVHVPNRDGEIVLGAEMDVPMSYVRI